MANRSEPKKVGPTTADAYVEQTLAEFVHPYHFSDNRRWFRGSARTGDLTELPFDEFRDGFQACLNERLIERCLDLSPDMDFCWSSNGVQTDRSVKNAGNDLIRSIAAHLHEIVDPATFVAAFPMLRR
ncbi:MAG: hypothetical protein AB7R77_14505 [Ilumatobacteraceae bacterium]